MRIIHFASGDLWAGAEVQLFHLAKALSKNQDIALLVVLLNHGQLESQLSCSGVKVQVLDESKISGFSIIKKFHAIVKQFQPDIVHTHRSKENIIGSLVAKLNGKKSVRTVHGATEFSVSPLNFRRFVFEYLDRFSGCLLQQKIIAVSSELKQKLSSLYPISKLEKVENCVDANYITRKSEETCDASINVKHYNIAFIGRFVPVKRADIFFEIAKKMISESPDNIIHFHMIGDGPLYYDIEKKIISNKLEARLHLHGFVKNTAPLLKRMNLLIFTSDHEGLPMTLLEAMTLRVPVLSKNLAGIRSVLCNAKCGYILITDEIKAYTDMISYIRDNTSEAISKANKARGEIDGTYNIEVNVGKYLRLYKNVLIAGM